MGIIPKIKVGLSAKKRETLKIGFDCATTASIGSIQPTLCREMVPNETFKVDVSSLVRLAPLAVPTFGRMSLRHYHAFVPYHSIWDQFDCMLSASNYTNGSTTWIPSSSPSIKGKNLFCRLLRYMDFTIYKGYDLDEDDAVTFNPIGMTLAQAQEYVTTYIKPAYNALVNGYLFKTVGGTDSSYQLAQDRGSLVGNLADDGYGVLNLGGFYQTLVGTPVFNPTSTGNNIIPYPGGGSIITESGADFITSFTYNNEVWTVCCKLRPVAKRYRQILIGLGYTCSPYNCNIIYNPFKLLAYYKAWFALFRPTREKQFTDTACFKLCQLLRNSSETRIESIVNGTNLWLDFLDELMTDCYYYLPMDYFSMAVTSPQQGKSISIGTGYLNAPAGSVQATASVDNTQSTVPNVNISSNYANSPVAQRLAQRLLTFANKNTVVGRSIRDWLRVHYGIIPDHDTEFNDVYIIGSSRVNINISDVMSTAQTSEGFLGEYAGRGIGFGGSEKFDFTAKEFGCWITFTVIVPESGMYQGYLLENRHFNRFQYFTDEFDALGYQVLERGEINDSYNCDGEVWNPLSTSSYDRTGAFGLVPRYSEYKVGRNIVNGDISLPSKLHSYASYNMDRRFSEGALGHKFYLSTQTDEDQNEIISNVVSYYAVQKPAYVPSVVYDNFRRIDPTDHIGQYNRIFTVTDNQDDKFILNLVFDVTRISPMKSLSSSFDSVQEDDKVIEVSHS